MQNIKNSITKRFGENKLLFQTPNDYLQDELDSMINYFQEYLNMDKIKIQNKESTAYGSFLLGFIEIEKNMFQVSNFSPKLNDYSEDLEFVLEIISKQKQICSYNKSSFLSPLPNQLIAVSNGALSNIGNIDGVRYSAPDHMSGWYITGEEYDNDIKSLRLIHAVELIEINPNIAIYLGLENNFRFNLSDEIKVWRDDTIEN
jgi:hypothetical protein